MNDEEKKAISALSFEEAFTRLEAILSKMNSGALSLDASLKLYQEADLLIHTCEKKLMGAERQIDVLMKNRSGELSLGQDQKPQVQDFKLQG